MTKKLKRLYIFTGKGGVGKTTLAMAMTKHLKDKGLNVLYNSFVESPDRELLNECHLPCFDINLQESAEIYIARKLNSKTIASWIMKTHFFKSLFQMIPGLSHMILLGHIIDELETHPDLTIVLDSPASGHALTMFESSSNFKKIFRAGLIVKDIDRMHRFLIDDQNIETVIISLATELSMCEAMDLEQELLLGITGRKLNIKRIINDSFIKFFEKEKISFDDLPSFLKTKVELEKKVVENHIALPHLGEVSQAKLVTSLAPFLEELT